MNSGEEPVKTWRLVQTWARTTSIALHSTALLRLHGSEKELSQVCPGGVAPVPPHPTAPTAAPGGAAANQRIHDNEISALKYMLSGFVHDPTWVFELLAMLQGNIVEAPESIKAGKMFASVSSAFVEQLGKRAPPSKKVSIIEFLQMLGSSIGNMYAETWGGFAALLHELVRVRSCCTAADAIDSILCEDSFGVFASHKLLKKFTEFRTMIVIELMTIYCTGCST